MHQSHRLQTILPGIEIVSIRSDRSFPRHSHDEFGFGYVASGGQHSWSGRGLVEARAGDTITANPGEMHDGLGHKGQPRQWNMMFLTADALSQLGGVQPDKAEFVLPVSSCQKVLAKTKRAFAALGRECADRNEAEQALMLALADQLNGSDADNASNRSRDVQMAMDMILQSWNVPLSLADLAAATGTSRFQILRRFSSEIGTTPYAFVTQYRVKRAKDMILLGTPLADAALACGFSDQSHLTRVFSRQFGLTPGCYSRRVCN